MGVGFFRALACLCSTASKVHPGDSGEPHPDLQGYTSTTAQRRGERRCLGFCFGHDGSVAESAESLWP